MWSSGRERVADERRRSADCWPLDEAAAAHPSTVNDEGNKAVVHGNRGRAPSNKLSDETRAHIVALRRTKYVGFNDQHFTEKLLSEEQVSSSRPTIQRLLRKAGIAAPQKRRGREAPTTTRAQSARGAHAVVGR